MTTRAGHIRTLALILVGVIPLPGPPPSLRNAADRAGELVGTAVRPAQLSEIAYATTLSREFNMVEPEDAMKWWVVRRNQHTFDFGPGDEVVRFAHAQGRFAATAYFGLHRDSNLGIHRQILLDRVFVPRLTRYGLAVGPGLPA